MMTHWLLAAFHLVALAIGFAAIMSRAALLRGARDTAALARVFVADTAWGIAALLWLATGVARAFAGYGKGSEYYLGNVWFWYKMAFFLLIILLELWPMITLVRWRIATHRGDTVDTSRALLFSRISFVQAALIIAMVFAATGMARGFGS